MRREHNAGDRTQSVRRVHGADGAFAASRALIDTLKAEVPIWKHQRFRDGSDEWVGTP